jgi:hypothetical protein
MKKIYMQPTMEVVTIDLECPLLTVSSLGSSGLDDDDLEFGGGSDTEAGAPTWVDKAYEFGGWDL